MVQVRGKSKAQCRIERKIDRSYVFNTMEIKLVGRGGIEPPTPGFSVLVLPLSFRLFAGRIYRLSTKSLHADKFLPLIARVEVGVELRDRRRGVAHAGRNDLEIHSGLGGVGTERMPQIMEPIAA
jgi:hypothetical protein